MNIVGLIGIIVSLVLFTVLVFKGWHSYWTAIVCAIIVALTNGLFWQEGGFKASLESFAGTYASGMIDLFATMFWVVMLGAILGKLYQDSGMTYSIYRLMNGFIQRSQGEARIRVSFVCLFIFGGLMGLGGIDPYVQLFIMAPICAGVCKDLDLPRKLVPGLMSLATGCFLVCPGAPNIYNIMGNAGINSVLGAAAEETAMAGGNPGTYLSKMVSSTSGVIVGIIGVLIISAGAFIVMTHFAKKAKAAGEHFEWGTMPPVEMTERPCPNVVLAIIPLVAVFVLYAVLDMHISFCISVGIILTIIFGFPYLPTTDRFNLPIGRGRSLINSMNAGAASGPNALLTVITPAALAQVITTTAVFGTIVGKLAGIDVGPILLCAIVTMILVAITSSPPAALMIALPMVVGVMMGRTMGTLDGVNLNAIMRIGVLAAATFETLPFNGTVLLEVDLAHTTHKDAYAPVGLISVGFTFIAMVVGVIIFTIAPNLP